MNKHGLFSLIFFLGLTGITSGSNLFCAVTGVWAVNDGEKVYRYEADNPAKKGNSAWDGKTIHLQGLYNEVLAFQVIVEADSSGARAVEVSVDPPVEVKSGKAIGTSPVLYGPGGSIEVFSEHYIRVKNPTKPLWFYNTPASAPKRMTGWIPDPLIRRKASADYPWTFPKLRQSWFTSCTVSRLCLPLQGRTRVSGSIFISPPTGVTRQASIVVRSGCSPMAARSLSCPWK